MFTLYNYYLQYMSTHTFDGPFYDKMQFIYISFPYQSINYVFEIFFTVIVPLLSLYLIISSLARVFYSLKHYRQPGFNVFLNIFQFILIISVISTFFIITSASYHSVGGAEYTSAFFLFVLNDLFEVLPYVLTCFLLNLFISFIQKHLHVRNIMQHPTDGDIQVK